jgi:stress response protein SCP2
LSFQPETQKMTEKSLILGELYLHNQDWKFRALGMGFQGGLAPLATSYGVDIDDESSQQEAEKQEPQKNIPASTNNAPAPVANSTSSTTNHSTSNSTVPAASKIELSKTTIDLRKSGEKATISLVKGGKISARLLWETKADLDLYCFYIDNSDKEDKVYYRKLGSLDQSPYIKLLGDSQVAGEEVVEISKPENVKYALLAAYSAVSNGIGSFYSYKAKIVVSDGEQQEVISHLAHKDPFSYWVAFALIDFTEAGKLTINNVETYSNKKTFARQFEERTGEKPKGLFRISTKKVNGVNSYDAEKSPYLFKDGSFMMSVGVREFK